MAFHTYRTITTSDAQKFFKGLTNDSQFFYSKTRRKTAPPSLRKRLHLSERSLLPQISIAWATLTTLQKAAWTTAGSYAHLNGWRAFVQESSQRIINGYSIPNTPSNFHLGKVGHLIIQSPATQIHIAQYHPNSYFIHQKVRGVKGLYAPVQITEPITLPVQIGFSYSSNLTPVGGTQYAILYIEVYSSYQGVDRVNTLEIPLSPSASWNTVSDSINQTLGYIKGYAVFIHIFGYQGDFYFDHVKIVHSGTNWARDKECSNIQQTFTHQYYEIPAHWVPLALPFGADYYSEYVP